jgi:predicted RNA-binding protein associated with RNAse of E/G family
MDKLIYIDAKPIIGEDLCAGTDHEQIQAMLTKMQSLNNEILASVYRSVSYVLNGQNIKMLMQHQESAQFQAYMSNVVVMACLRHTLFGEPLPLYGIA